MKCPNCGSDSSGAFCAECGTPLKGARCKSCNAALQPGASFCTGCGTSVRGGAARTNPAWYVAGAALVVLIGVLLWPVIGGGGADNSASDGRMPIGQIPDDDAAAQQGSPPELTGTPREQADRLFNRVMTELSTGDTARAKFFQPMAVQAYDMAGDLDNDGLYHKSLLQALGDDFAGARASAEKILSFEPNHLLALSAAAAAARGQGDTTAAQNYYRKFLAAYDAESERDLPEYRDHGRVFADLKAEAEAFLK